MKYIGGADPELVFVKDDSTEEVSNLLKPICFLFSFFLDINRV